MTTSRWQPLGGPVRENGQSLWDFPPAAFHCSLLTTYRSTEVFDIVQLFRPGTTEQCHEPRYSHR